MVFCQTELDSMIVKKPPTKEDFMAMNRKARRRIGKVNGVKIPGSNKPFIKIKVEYKNSIEKNEIITS